jgi:hypothetical protein
MKTRMLLALVLAWAGAACGGTHTYRAATTTRFGANTSSLAQIHHRFSSGSDFGATAYFRRYERGYQFQISLYHPDEDWTGAKGWTVWLEDAKGRRIDATEVTTGIMYDTATGAPPPPNYLRSGGGGPGGGDREYTRVETEPSSLTDKSIGTNVEVLSSGGALPPGRTATSEERTSNDLFASFLVPELAAASPGRLTLVMKRGDDVLRFEWHLAP